MTQIPDMQYKDKQIDHSVQEPLTPNGLAVVLTHGAGGDKDMAHLMYLEGRLVEEGYLVVRFTCKGLNITHRINVYVHVVVSM